VRLYSCRFAPNGDNPFHAIRVAQRVVDHGESVLEAFAPDAFASRSANVPVLLDHDHGRRAGTIRAMVAHGDWHIADFILDGPYAAQAAEWIETSGRVSPGFTALERDAISAKEPAPMNWYLRATLDEISVIPPGSIAWYVGAKITRVSELPQPTSSAVETPRVEPAAGEVVLPGRGQRIVRHNSGEVLGVR
jgi:hypothetical protein